MMNCQICGVPLKDDLFSFVTQEPVCSICKIKYIWGQSTPARIAAVRLQLGLKEGEYVQQDRGAEARKILGRDS